MDLAQLRIDLDSFGVVEVREIEDKICISIKGMSLPNMEAYEDIVAPYYTTKECCFLDEYSLKAVYIK